MKLQELMVKDVIQAAPEETVGVAGKRMRESAVGCLVVTGAGAVKGIVTDRVVRKQASQSAPTREANLTNCADDDREVLDTGGPG